MEACLGLPYIIRPPLPCLSNSWTSLPLTGSVTRIGAQTLGKEINGPSSCPCLCVSWEVAEKTWGRPPKEDWWLLLLYWPLELPFPSAREIPVCFLGLFIGWTFFWNAPSSLRYARCWNNQLSHLPEAAKTQKSLKGNHHNQTSWVSTLPPPPSPFRAVGFQGGGWAGAD